MIIRTFLSIITILFLIYSSTELSKSLPVGFNPPANIVEAQVRQSWKILGVSDILINKSASAVANAATRFELDPVKFAVLIYTESSVNINAKNPISKYGGLGGTSPYYENPEVDAIKAAYKFSYHITQAKGDVLEGLISYKGGVSTEGRKIAKEQALYLITLWNKVGADIYKT